MAATLIRNSATVVYLTTILAIFSAHPILAADSSQKDSKHFTYEFYYKIKWGYFEEWMELYKKNHYPILKRLKDMGHIVRMDAASPIDHSGESDRWDIRFTIVYLDAETAFSQDDYGVVKELFPDQDTFRKEEKRRFELILEHRDIPIRQKDISAW